mmetsp:Transcript_61148/g.138340  ORF Transcript_61148/g.138340 Transcript_61148/m.138340 type:complete len:568 (-) Transcript_61148:181-1884(-)
MQGGADDQAGAKLLRDDDPALDDGEVSEELFLKLCWRILPLMWMGYVFNIVDRTNLGFAESQMRPDLGISPASFGLASGLFFLSYSMLQVPCNHLVERFGASRVLATSMVCWGTVSALTCLVENDVQLCMMRFLLGLAESGFFPGSLLFLTKWFPDEKAGRAVAIFSSATSVGSLISSAGSGFMLYYLDGVWGIRGWRWLLALQGAPTVFLGLAVPWCLPEEPRKARWLSGLERRALEGALARSKRTTHDDDDGGGGGGGSDHRGPLGVGGKGGVPSAVEGGAAAALELGAAHSTTRRAGGASGLKKQPAFWKRLELTMKLKSTWHFALQYVGVTAATNMARFFLPMQIKEVFPSLTAWQLGLVFTVPAVAKIVLAPVAAGIADAGGLAARRCVAKSLFGGAACVLVGVGLLMLSRTDGADTGPDAVGGDRQTRNNSSGAALVLALMSADVAVQCGIPVFWSAHHEVQARVRGPSIAFVNSVGNLGGFAGPWLLGAMHDLVGSICTDSSARLPSEISASAALGAAKEASCTAQWGGGTLLIGLAFAFLTSRTLFGISKDPHSAGGLK